MRYLGSEKLEIIRTVEASHLPTRRTLEMTCAPKTPPFWCRVRPTKGRTNEAQIYG